MRLVHTYHCRKLSLCQCEFLCSGPLQESIKPVQKKTKRQKNFFFTSRYYFKFSDYQVESATSVATARQKNAEALYCRYVFLIHWWFIFMWYASVTVYFKLISFHLLKKCSCVDALISWNEVVTYKTISNTELLLMWWCVGQNCVFSVV